MDTTNFQFALNKMRDGRYVGRPAWGHRCYLFLDGDLLLYSSNGYDSPWVPGHPDLLAEDWGEVIPHP